MKIPLISKKPTSLKTSEMEYEVKKKCNKGKQN